MNLAGGLAALADHLDDKDLLNRGANRIVAEFERLVVLDPRDRSPSAPYDLAKGLDRLAEHIDEAEVNTLSERILQAMDRTDDPHDLRGLGDGLKALAERVGARYANDVAASIVKAMGHASRETEDRSAREQLEHLAEALAALAGRVDSSQASSLSEYLVGTIDRPEATSAVDEGLKALAAQVGPRDAGPLAKRIVEAMERHDVVETLALLGGELQRLSGVIEEREAASLAAHIVEAIQRRSSNDKSDENTFALNELAAGMARLGGRVESREAGPLAKTIVALMGKNNALGSLAKALAGLAQHVEPDLPRRGALRIVEAMESAGTYSLPRLAAALSVLAPHVEPELPGRGVERLLNVMESNEGNRSSGDFARLSVALASLPKHVDRDRFARVVKCLAAGREGGVLREFPTGFFLLCERIGENSGIVHRLVETARPLAYPPCAAAAPLAGTQSLHELIELLKWPTCRPEDRDVIIERIAVLTGTEPTLFGAYKKVGRDSEDRYHASLRRFVEWAADKHAPGSRRFNLTTPPKSPF